MAVFDILGFNSRRNRVRLAHTTVEQKTIINGHTVSYDSSLAEGLRYLMYQINEQEQKVFFDEAYARGSAAFRDHMGYNYKLIHHGGEYQLVKV